MGTKILQKTLMNKIKLIGCCSDKPIDVLLSIMETHYIHEYKGIYMPIDSRWSNSIYGLIIESCSDPTELKISDLDLKEAAITYDKREISDILKYLEVAKVRYTTSKNDMDSLKRQEKDYDVIKEIKYAILGIKK